MSVATRITMPQYDRMVESGAFDAAHAQRVELVQGELREMNPIGPTHEEVVDLLVDWTIACDLRERVRLRVQQSIGLPEQTSAPQPDVVWSVPKSYRGGRPTGSDVLLLVEVADSSLAYDRGEKAALYAQGGIADYWIVNLIDQCVEVHRQPERGRYTRIERIRLGEEVRPLAFSDTALDIQSLFQS